MIGVNILSGLKGKIRVEINIQQVSEKFNCFIILKFFFLVYTSISKIKKLLKKKKGMNPNTSFTKSPFYEDCRYLLSLFKN